MGTKSIKDKIKEFFYRNPTTRIRVRQLERELKLPLPSVIRYTNELEKENILKTTIISEVKFFSAYRSSKEYLLEKKLFNLKEIYNSGLIEYLDSELINPTIILFGSYSLGEDIEKSDIDLFIESKKKELILDKFEKRLQRKIQIFLFKSIEEVKNKELANNIINGIRLKGLIEVYK